MTVKSLKKPKPRVSAFIEKMRPIDSRVVIRVEEIATVTAGGIIVPDAVAEAQRPARGVVLQVGPNCTEIEAGDYVVFMMYAGSHLENPDDERRKQDEEDKTVYRVVREKEVFGVWKKGDWRYREGYEPVADND